MVIITLSDIVGVIMFGMFVIIGLIYVIYETISEKIKKRKNKKQEKI